VGTSGNVSQIPGELSNVVLEVDGEDQLDKSCEIPRRIYKVNERKNLQTIKRRKAN
jgi:hypothetical protein